MIKRCLICNTNPSFPVHWKEVHTANGGFISLLGIVQLTVQINHLNTHVDAYVTRDLICPMILGRDWIQQNYVNISFCTNRIYLYHGLASTPLVPIPRRESVIMSLSHSIVIPPFHQQFIYGYVPIESLDDALFTSNRALQRTRMILLPYTLLHMRDNRGIISIINNTRHSKLIPRDTPLGLVSSSTAAADLNMVDASPMNSSESFFVISVFIVMFSLWCSLF